ncbi:ATP-dependent protease ATPase subunit ClpY [Alloiococcus otitis]|uniref:ATP-dependent protease ATPase subunit HslU n=1 Tax=Alloiococcus otitis ATCC 51267 TaxID=883081 RepID=K9EA61_9LACT|nr:ATP-dependent protease ATPase subunit HslU [Alloiococcus otitis]EKU94119.1 ATP-dependent protease HslVU, ATPase subunit [Alloiococcus otitis ATCC 51267]SUU80967.1 ATP-dependent protease ATPase subunit ClpY [Alloiococcus otitis]
MKAKLDLSPREIVDRLNQYIIGQDEAKKSVAIALRNRYRRLQLDSDMQKEITPKNILMIGPTGVGKTEIARRLADIVNAPFVKIEATKFTEVGYVGRDVESMVRDLIERAVRLVREEKRQEVRPEARQAAIKRVAKALAPGKRKNHNQANNPFASMMNSMGVDTEALNRFNQEAEEEEEVSEEVASKRRDIVDQIKRGVIDQKEVDIKVEEKKQTPNSPMTQQFEQLGLDFSDTLGSLTPNKKVKRTVTVEQAVDIFTEEEADKLINSEDIHAEAVQLAENNGLIFIDEIDKITSTNDSQGSGQVSREGVQRDILPIVEGSAVRTKYGTVHTDHILFIGSGAFHLSKPSDLIPELQGRFPIRVELNDLTAQDFVSILTEPNNALVEQYKALLGTENIEVIFTMDAIEKIADIAFRVNENTDNIGARRLHTILEKLLEDLLFEASDMNIGQVKITEQYVEDKIGHIAGDQDLSQYIL